MNRGVVALAGLFGAGGVALSAAAAHAGADAGLDTAARFLLIHAATLLAIGLYRDAGRILTISAWVLAIGTVLFSGDLTLRATAGFRFFPMAAPLGGFLMIAGWVLVALSALAPRRPTGNP